MFSNGENQAENKLLLLYLLSEVDGEAYQRQVIDLILDHEIMNYFTVQQLVSELKKAELIVENLSKTGTKKLGLTSEGENALRYFINRIPKKRLLYFQQLVKERKQALQENFKILSSMQELQDGNYLIKLGIIKNGEEELFLKLRVSSLQESKRILANWNKNHNRISKELYSQLMDK